MCIKKYTKISNILSSLIPLMRNNSTLLASNDQQSQLTPSVVRKRREHTSDEVTVSPCSLQTTIPKGGSQPQLVPCSNQYIPSTAKGGFQFLWQWRDTHPPSTHPCAASSHCIPGQSCRQQVVPISKSYPAHHHRLIAIISDIPDGSESMRSLT
jgi:hypothetical protein